jgi:hypothetical protein
VRYVVVSFRGGGWGDGGGGGGGGGGGEHVRLRKRRRQYRVHGFRERERERDDRAEWVLRWDCEWGIGKGCGEKMGNGGVLYCHMMMIGMGSNPTAEDEHPL